MIEQPQEAQRFPKSPLLAHVLGTANELLHSAESNPVPSTKRELFLRSVPYMIATMYALHKMETDYKMVYWYFKYKIMRPLYDLMESPNTHARIRNEDMPHAVRTLFWWLYNQTASVLFKTICKRRAIGLEYLSRADSAQPLEDITKLIPHRVKLNEPFDLAHLTKRQCGVVVVESLPAGDLSAAHFQLEFCDSDALGHCKAMAVMHGSACYPINAGQPLIMEASRDALFIFFASVSPVSSLNALARVFEEPQLCKFTLRTDIGSGSIPFSADRSQLPFYASDHIFLFGRRYHRPLRPTIVGTVFSRNTPIPRRPSGSSEASALNRNGPRPHAAPVHYRGRELVGQTEEERIGNEVAFYKTLPLVQDPYSEDRRYNGEDTVIVGNGGGHMCPLSGSLAEYPCYSKACSFPHVFDYLSIVQTKAPWTCPLCGRFALRDTLVRFDAPSRPVEPESPPPRCAPTVVVIDDDDDGDDGGDGEEENPRAQPVRSRLTTLQMQRVQSRFVPYSETMMRCAINVVEMMKETLPEIANEFEQTAAHLHSFRDYMRN